MARGLWLFRFRMALKEWVHWEIAPGAPVAIGYGAKLRLFWTSASDRVL
ncbi:protein of unknown function [Candidatus Methylocalor cossyra]|uniref:Uncharacterized protein n=1 Tax=Candidatus Methylocalor cossyra TaxID=3108543 RepID=A0ABM9NJR1_9GAMM